MREPLAIRQHCSHPLIHRYDVPEEALLRLEMVIAGFKDIIVSNRVKGSNVVFCGHCGSRITLPNNAEGKYAPVNA